MTNYLIVGNGIAGTTAAEAIRKQNAEGDITIVTEEDVSFYYRIRLNEYLSGDMTEKELIGKGEDWYGGHNITLKLNTRISAAIPEERILVTAADERIGYDKLLLATGSHSFIPPIKGSEKKGVFALRSIQDARDISSWAGKVKDVVLIGGGLLGLEAGNALRKLGKKVTVVEFFPRLLPRQLDLAGAERLQKTLEGMGFSFRLGAKTEAIAGSDGVDGVRLEGGETLPAGMVIVSAGVRPNMELAKDLGLEQDKGIRVNERLQTSSADIYAAGDVAEFRGMPYGIWPAAMEQGKIAGTNMAGGDMVYAGTTMANTLKVAGVDLASAGNIDADNVLESKVFADDAVYRKVVLEKDRIVGCIMLGNTKGFSRITKAMEEKLNVSDVKDEILSDKFQFKG